jgi:hypothetical protein
MLHVTAPQGLASAKQLVVRVVEMLSTMADGGPDREHDDHDHDQRLFVLSC